jgi:putative transposase
MTPPPDPDHRHRYPAEIINHAVWLYHVFSLSLRDVELILAERSVAVSSETVRRWCKKFAASFADRLRRRFTATSVPVDINLQPLQPLTIARSGRMPSTSRALDYQIARRRHLAGRQSPPGLAGSRAGRTECLAFGRGYGQSKRKDDRGR